MTNCRPEHGAEEEGPAAQENDTAYDHRGWHAPAGHHEANGNHWQGSVFKLLACPQTPQQQQQVTMSKQHFSLPSPCAAAATGHDVQAAFVESFAVTAAFVTTALKNEFIFKLTT
jgi:hypothetical protein